MRIAWNVRVAGWDWPGLERGKQLSTILASCKVVVTGRAATIALAILRDARSSPYRKITFAMASSSASFTKSAADGPSWLIRISRGPSRMNENPRSARSSCMDETPRSRTTPSRSDAYSSSFENVPCTNLMRSPKPETQGSANSNASGSRSTPITCAAPASSNSRV